MGAHRITTNDLKAVCSVSEMADLLGLSRSRFYQLKQQGVFPQPLHDRATRRPFYSQHLQERCLEIRNTGLGHNRQAVLFYRRRKRRSSARTPAVTGRYAVLISVFKQLGIKTTPKQLRAALKELYPEGSPQCIDDDSVVQDLISHWGRGLSK